MKKKYLIFRLLTLLFVLGTVILLFIPNGVVIDEITYSYVSKVVFTKYGFIPLLINIGCLIIFVSSIVSIFINKRVLNISIASFLFLLTILSFSFLAFSKTVINWIHPIFCLISFIFNGLIVFFDFKDNQ